MYAEDTYHKLLSEYQATCQLTDNWNLYEQIHQTKWLTTCDLFEIKLKLAEEWLKEYEKSLQEKDLKEKASEELQLQNTVWHEEKEQWQKEKAYLHQQIQKLQVSNNTWKTLFL
jgi:hypothetical protein